MAGRLGLWQMKLQLEEHGFAELHPQQYAEIGLGLQRFKEANQERMERLLQHMRRVLARDALLQEYGMEVEVS